MDALETKVTALIRKLAEAGLTVIDTKPVAYGKQLLVSDGDGKIPVTVYSGKKGVTITVGGSDGVPLRQVIRQLLLDSPPQQVLNPGGRPPGFEAVADFDYRWIGTDESGKGDFFGPLVVSAVLVDADSADSLTRKGIKDSKLLSDEKVRALAAAIREVCHGRFVEVELVPARYNALYRQFQAEGKNLNQLLAWGHSRALEDLLAKEPCRFALADQFANERQILSRLMERGRQLTLVQTPRAERNVAVAAASILARDRFLARLADFSVRFGMQFPKGASNSVVEAAKAFAARHGRDLLTEVGKTHFKTMQQI